uniref:Transposase (Putative), gypsy type n=1 Tax=Tanacetum cinerariifolium TaxID=118510 RepID=A0A6L2NBC4_TANCI|nr:hypothetical protein [Tanacetum cinerariifolium]
MSRNPFPKSTEFRADDYAILFAHPAPFQKFPEPFLCLIGMSRNYTLDEDIYLTFLYDDGTEMDLFAFIQVKDPTKVKVRERERVKGEARLLDSTIGCVVPLLPVASARTESKLEASVERLFDEGGSADQGDSVIGGGHDAEIELSTGVRIIIAENVTAERPKRPRKKRQAATDAGGPYHPPKKLKGDYRTSGKAATSGKSPFVLKELLASRMLNFEAGVAAVVTLPMVTSSMSATPEHESGPPTDSITELNLRTLDLTDWFVISSYSSHHSSTNVAEAGIDSFVRSVTPPPVKTEAVITTNVSSIPSAPDPETDTKVVTPVYALMFHDSDSIGTVKPVAAGSSHVLERELSMGSRDVNSETLYEIRKMDYHHLFTEFNVGTTCQACLNAEVKMQTKFCLSKRRRAVEKMYASEIDALKQKNVALENEKGSLDGKVQSSDLWFLPRILSLRNLALLCLFSGLRKMVHELETTCSDLHGQVSGYKRLKEQIKEFQDTQMNVVNDKVAKLEADLLEMALHLEEIFYPHILNTIFGWRWLLTRDLKLAIRLREVDFSLLVELKSHKDTSTVDIMDLFRLEGSLTDAPGKSDLQPNIKQLKLLIHCPEDQVILGETSLLVALDVTHSRVEMIMENVAAWRSALIGVWTPLVDPLSVENLVGAASTSDSMPTTVATTTALSLSFAFASTVPPITIEDYEIIGTDVQGSGQGEAVSFPNTVEFEKEEFDTTLKRNPPS